MLYCHLLIHAEIYIYMLNTYRRNDKRRRKTSFTKYLPLILLQGFEKGYSRFACEREREIEHNCNILTPLSFGRQCCLSRSPDAHTGPTLLGDGFPYCILSATSLVLKLHRGSQGPPRPGVAFPITFRLSPTPTLLQLPLGLELNCTAFCSIRRLFITFKLPRGDMDTPPRLRNFSRYLAIGVCPFRYLWNGLCDRHRAEITVIRMCHFLPVHHLGMAFLAGSKAKI